MFRSRSPRRLSLVLGLLLGILAFSAAGAVFAQEPGHASAEPAAVASDHAHNSLDGMLLGLVVILVGAKLGGEVVERMGQPAVLGEIVVGILLGNLGLLGFHGLDFVHSNDWIHALAELGVIILLFEVGLESNIEEMRQVGLSAFLVASIGVIIPILLGIGVAWMFLPHASPLVWVFVGATLCATSVGITARVLRDLGQVQRPEARIVLGAAVIDDVMGLVVLAAVGGTISAAAHGSALGLGEIALILLKALGFLVGAIVLGGYLAPRLLKAASYLNVNHMLLATSLGFCLLLAWLAAQIQLAPIVGAFAAGLVLDRVHYRDFADKGEHQLEDLIRPIGGFLVPAFFVLTGVKVDLHALADPKVLLFAAALTAVAILGKQACGLAVIEKGLDRLSVGLGMIPRGEVGLIFANQGQMLLLAGVPVISSSTYSAVVVMVMVTTLITPPLLKWSLSRSAVPSLEPVTQT